METICKGFKTIYNGFKTYSECKTDLSILLCPDCHKETQDKGSMPDISNTVIVDGKANFACYHIKQKHVGGKRYIQAGSDEDEN